MTELNLFKQLIENLVEKEIKAIETTYNSKFKNKAFADVMFHDSYNDIVNYSKKFEIVRNFLQSINFSLNFTIDEHVSEEQIKNKFEIYKQILFKPEQKQKYGKLWMQAVEGLNETFGAVVHYGKKRKVYNDQFSKTVKAYAIR